MGSIPRAVSSKGTILGTFSLTLLVQADYIQGAGQLST
jgi:hypothetical protein